MALANYRQRSNIRRSVAAKVGNSITTAGAVVVPVLWDDVWADPDAARDDDGTPLDAWIQITWLTDGAGRGRRSTFQADCYRRILGETDADSDPLGIEVDDIADAFEEVFSGVTADGNRRGYFPVLDFISSAVAPPDTGECGVVQSFAGRLGEADDARVLPAAEGFQRRTLRFAVALVRDLLNTPEHFYA